MLVILFKGEDSLAILDLPLDDLPDAGVEGSPVDVPADFGTDSDVVETEVVRLGLEFFLKFLFEVVEEGVAAWKSGVPVVGEIEGWNLELGRFATAIELIELVPPR